MRAAKTDALQASIVAMLRQATASVQVLSGVGHGCPDLLVGWRGQNLLLEIKSKRGVLTPDQVTWHQAWRGNVYVVRSVLEAVNVLEGVR